MSDDPHQALIEAANYFNQASRARLTRNNRFHPETLILSVSRMAGSLMFRSFEIDTPLEPGTTVLSEQANVYGPKLMNLMFATLGQLGNPVGQADIDNDYASARLSPLSFKGSLERLAPLYLGYCETTSLGFHDAALGAAIATGITVHDCSQVLAAEKGCALAIYGFVEGTKTAPFPVVPDPEAIRPSPTAKSPKKPWYKPW